MSKTLIVLSSAALGWFFGRLVYYLVCWEMRRYEQNLRRSYGADRPK